MGRPKGSKNKTVTTKYTLTKSDLQKVLTGAVVAASGAFATVLLQELGQMDFGEYTPIVVMVLSILSNVVRKYMTNTK